MRPDPCAHPPLLQDGILESGAEGTAADVRVFLSDAGEVVLRLFDSCIAWDWFVQRKLSATVREFDQHFHRLCWCVALPVRAYGNVSTFLPRGPRMEMAASNSLLTDSP